MCFTFACVLLVCGCLGVVFAVDFVMLFCVFVLFGFGVEVIIWNVLCCHFWFAFRVSCLLNYLLLVCIVFLLVVCWI